MTYDEMLAQIAEAKGGMTLDGLQALATMPRVAKTGLRNEPMPEGLRNKPLTGAMLTGLMAALAPVIARHVDDKVADAVRPLQQRIAELVAELESRPSPKWRGAFVHGATYRQLEFVVDHGALWICKTDTNTRPGHNDHWQLCVKRGAHG